MLSLEKSVTRTLLLRIWTVISGFGLAITIPAFLSPTIQGFYYTFSSIIGIQVFFELGLSQVLVYRFSDLRQASLTLSEESVSRLKKLLFASRLIYRCLGVLFFVVTVFAGFIFFSHHTSPNVYWQAPWFLLVAATSINLIQSVKLAFLEAVGEMHHVSVARFRASFISTCLVYLVLICGGGLWAACIIPSCNACWFTIWLVIHRHASPYRAERVNLDFLFSEVKRLWLRDIFPMQWKISLSWISGYFIFQLYTPLVFSRFGSIQAGKLGYSISILTALLVVATTFTTALAPKLSSLYSEAKYKEFIFSFERSLLFSSLSLIILPMSLVIATWICAVLKLSISDRLLSLNDIFIYALTTIFTGFTSCISIFLRSQQREPLLLNSITTSIVMIPTLIFSSGFSLTAMLFSACIVQLLSLLWALQIYRRSRLNLCNLI